MFSSTPVSFTYHLILQLLTCGVWSVPIEKMLPTPGIQDIFGWSAGERCICSEMSLFCCLLNLNGWDPDDFPNATYTEILKNLTSQLSKEQNKVLALSLSVTAEPTSSTTTASSNIHAYKEKNTTNAPVLTPQPVLASTTVSPSRAAQNYKATFYGCGLTKCSKGTGLYQTSKGCQYFISCWNSCGWIQECPSFLVFNDAKQRCEWRSRLAKDHKCFSKWL